MSYGDEALKPLAACSHPNPARLVEDAITSAENLVVLYGSRGLGIGRFIRPGICLCRPVSKTKHMAGPNNGLIGVWPHANDQGCLGDRVSNLPRTWRKLSKARPSTSLLLTRSAMIPAWWMHSKKPNSSSSRNSSRPTTATGGCGPAGTGLYRTRWFLHLR